jgi:hypothetical protein
MLLDSCFTVRDMAQKRQVIIIIIILFRTQGT